MNIIYKNLNCELKSSNLLHYKILKQGMIVFNFILLSTTEKLKMM